jgi:serine/threonine protein kinase
MTETSVNSRRSVFGFSRRYSPPEQIQDLGTSPRSDIYALGATLYHLFTGVKPPDAITRATALAEGKPDPLRPAHEVYAEVGPDIAVVLNRAMALNPDDRCGSAEEFRDGLYRVDYSRWAVANEFALAIPPQTVNTVSVSTTVAAVKQSPPLPEPSSEPRKIIIDNLFSTNSVFNAESSTFQSPLLPEPNRMPFLAVAIFAFLLIGFMGIRYDWADTLLGQHVDDVKQESMLTAGDKPLEQRRTDTYDAKPAKKIGVSGNSRPSPRRNEREKRVNHR